MKFGKLTGNKGYPTVMIHGFMAFGEETRINDYCPYWGFGPHRNLLKHLRGEGYEVFSPHVGPFNSAWDRSCIIWAYLMGGTVDFGKVHSEKYGHARYGRTYPGVLKDWGTNDAHKMINIIGHSFGGPTVKAFADLVANGSAEERAGTDPADLSPFFAENKPQKIHTVTALSGVMNGTTFASLWGEKGMVAATWVAMLLTTLLGNTAAVDWYDFYMDHWGVMPDPKDRTYKFTNPFAHTEGIKAYAANTKDSIAREMQVETAQEINKLQTKLDPETYYFCRRADRSHKTKKGNYKLGRDSSFIMCNIAGYFTGKYIPKGAIPYGVDESWFPNDGFVNVIGQSAPFSCPSEDINTPTQAKPGMWYNLPVERKDHISWAGLGEKRKVFFAYFDDMFNDFKKLK